MDFGIKLKLDKRKDEIYDFYYRGIGDKIKRTRLEQKLTQEVLAKGICSNTYISKIENNKIAVNREQLFLIMEKMGIPANSIIYPEKMVDSLDLSLKCFYYRDLSVYEELFQDVESYDYGILLSIIKLGYYVLNEDYEKATPIYNEMYRYLNSLEDYGFAVFIIYGCFYNIGIGDYQNARLILESIESNLRNDSHLSALFHYVKFIVFGKLQLYNMARDNLIIAQNNFMMTGNQKRLTESLVYNNIFHLYESTKLDIGFDPIQFEDISMTLRNYYVIMLAFKAEEPIQYLEYLRPEGEHYQFGMFLIAWHYLEANKKEEYQEIKREINNLHYQLDCRIDYGNLIKHLESNDKLYLKSYIIDYILPYLIEKQELFFFKKATEAVSNILYDRKRYKDSINYHRKYEEFLNRLQKEKRY